jgi:hypothetical protein
LKHLINTNLDRWRRMNVEVLRPRLAQMYQTMEDEGRMLTREQVMGMGYGALRRTAVAEDSENADDEKDEKGKGKAKTT